MKTEYTTQRKHVPFRFWDDSAIARLHRYIAKHGPIETVRVSAASQSSCCPWSYWSPVRGEIRNRQSDGLPTCVSRRAATRVYRSIGKASEQAYELCNREDRIFWDLGPMTEHDAVTILTILQERHEQKTR